MVEYAFFLALIAGGILVTVQLLSHSTSKAFDTVAVAVDHADAPRSSRVPNTATSSEMPSSLPAQASSFRWQAYLPAAQAVSMIVLIGLWLVVRRDTKIARKIIKTSTVDQNLSEKRQQRIFVKRQEILNVLTEEMEALMDSRVQVSHLMSGKLRTVAPNTTAQQVVEMMEQHHIRHLLVCDPTKKLLGIISDRDLRKTTASSARELMTPDPLHVAPDTLVSPAVTLMMKECISALPVVEEGRAVGMLTSTDLMMALQCSMQILQKVAFIVGPSQAQAFEENTMAC